MASLQEIKTRLAAITNTKKITKAMQFVATVKLKKSQRNLASIQEYYTSVCNMFQELLANVGDISKIIPKNGQNVTAYVIITSDIGLCGSYNSNVYKAFKKQAQINDQLFVIGTKGVSHFKMMGQKIFLELPSVGDKPNYELAAKISRDIIAQYMLKKINKVKLIYTKFVNSITFETKTTLILPIEKASTIKTKKNVLIEFEPSPEKVLKAVIPLYVSTMFFGSMVESKVSEMCSRRIAMENATDNANELKDLLNIEYNKIRQASITQEITEIIAGSDYK